MSATIKPPCPTHRPSTLGYVERAIWADEQIKKGLKQKKCEECGRWYFDSEM